MIIDGVDLSTLEHDVPKDIVAPPMVKGRVAHIDADFLAYQVSAVPKGEERTLAQMKHKHDMAVERIRLMAGAEKTILHLTPKQADEDLYKGGRYNAAIQREYQGNRKNKEKPKLLHVVRNWMHEERGAMMHYDIEADDGMAIAQYDAIKSGNRDKSIIATADKDLLMVPGLMLDWNNYSITDTDENDHFGFLTLDSSKTTKKLKGRGWKFFWAQMLMGDTADNIQGLPLVCDPRFLKGKPKACGPVMAYDLLNDVKTNREAFELVRDLYKFCGEHCGYVNYRDQSPVEYGDVFMSEAQLLWMRRKHDISDALDWLQEECL